MKYLIKPIFIIIATQLVFTSACYAQENAAIPDTRLVGQVLTLLSFSADSTKELSIDSTHLSNQPVQLISVKDNLNTYHAETENGEFRFYNVKPGRYKLIVQDPELENVHVVIVDVLFSARGRARMKPIILDRVNQSVKVSKDIRFFPNEMAQRQ